MERNLAINGHWRDFAAPARVHFIGAAGAGMRALRDIVQAIGHEISGSDLKADGDLVSEPGHAAENIDPRLDLVIYSDAVPEDNCERRRANRLGVLQLSYAEAVAELSALRRTFAVAGSHGKSTVTAMTAAILQTAGLDPTVVCGATPIGWASGGRLGRDDVLLLEACEFRRNFLRYRPQTAALLGVELDHFDCYASQDELAGAFAQFVGQSKQIVFNADCAVARRLALDVSGESFAIDQRADWQAGDCDHRGGTYRFTLLKHRCNLGRVNLKMPGRHNVANALAAAAVASAAGADAAALVAGLNRFAGLRRRMEATRVGPGICWVDDFAHHPTEVASALAAAREICPTGKIWAVFQPHQHSRTKRLLAEFAASLQACDRLFLAEIYRAREASRPDEVRTADLAAAISALGSRIEPGHDLDEIQGRLQSAIAQCELTQNDLIITMGAGDVGRLGRGLANSGMPMGKLDLSRQIRI